MKKVEITQEEASSFAEQLKVDFQTPILEIRISCGSINT